MKIDRNSPVGVFDSGVGGLTVVREIMRNLPSEKIVYFGDTARVPYGSKSKDTVIRYSRQIIRFLQEQQVKAIVIACNTASAFALDVMKEEFDIPAVGDVGKVLLAMADAEEDMIRLLRYRFSSSRFCLSFSSVAIPSAIPSGDISVIRPSLPALVKPFSTFSRK